MRTFCTTGACNPKMHYMVHLQGRIHEIKTMVDNGAYFIMNKPRQFGKTTTLNALEVVLRENYAVISLDFEFLDESRYQSSSVFTQAVAQLVLDAFEFNKVEIPKQQKEALETLCANDPNRVTMADLFRIFRRWCLSSIKPIVLIIDEVDHAASNQIFLDFLAQLRAIFLSRNGKDGPAFWSVILTGVTDVKRFKRKLRPEEEHKLNSPWNIVAPFDVDISLPEDGIADMLAAYESDHQTGMDVKAVAREIYAATSGYPYLVSRICQIIDLQMVGKGFRSLSDAWTIAGVSEAVRRMLYETNPLFDSLMTKLTTYPHMSAMIQRILFDGERILYNPDSTAMDDARMYGFLQNDDGNLKIANRIFEVRLYNFYLSADEMQQSPWYQAGAEEKSIFLHHGRLMMQNVMKRFMTVFTDIYAAENTDRFSEAEGRRRFLLFIRPIINGTGNYYIEPQTRDNKRMDLVVDYACERHVIEFKIWGGKAYHEKGEKQLAAYLDACHLHQGYLLTFRFTKGKKSEMVQKTVHGKELIEVFV